MVSNVCNIYHKFNKKYGIIIMTYGINIWYMVAMFDVNIELYGR